MNEQRHAILFNDEQLGPYPAEKLKRVEKPTTDFPGPFEQRRADDTVESKAGTGAFGEKARQGAMEFIDKEPVFRAFFDINTLLSSWEPGPVAEKKSDLPADRRVLTRHVKSLCHFLGADVVGICELTKDVLYSHNAAGEPIDVDYKYAIVVGVRKQRSAIDASYGCEWIDDAISMQAYQRLGCICTTLTNYIRRMGWPAEVSMVPKYYTLMPRLVCRAGLGEFSRMGIVVSPFLGGLGKYACVLTDLPVLTDKPIDFGLQDYCEKCHICADQCCSNAVQYGGKVLHNGGVSWVIKEQNCAVFNMTNPVGKVCQRCVKNCPWDHMDSDPAAFRDWDGSVEALHAMADERAAFLREHNFVHPDEEHRKWWLPLRYDFEEQRYREAREFDYAKHERKMALLEKKQQK